MRDKLIVLIGFRYAGMRHARALNSSDPTAIIGKYCSGGEQRRGDFFPSPLRALTRNNRVKAGESFLPISGLFPQQAEKFLVALIKG
jgi:hypothetical protein